MLADPRLQTRGPWGYLRVPSPPGRLLSAGPGIRSVGPRGRGPACVQNAAVPAACTGSPRGEGNKGLGVALGLLWQKFCIYERHAAACWLPQRFL